MTSFKLTDLLSASSKDAIDRLVAEDKTPQTKNVFDSKAKTVKEVKAVKKEPEKNKKTQKKKKNSQRKNKYVSSSVYIKSVYDIIHDIPGMTLDKVRKYLNMPDLTRNYKLSDYQNTFIHKESLKDPDIIKARKRRVDKMYMSGSVHQRLPVNKEKEKFHWVSIVSIPMGGMNK